MDIRHHTDHELQLIVNNDEIMYNDRFNLTRELLIEGYGIICSDIQWEVFRQDIEEQLREYGE